MSKMVFNLVKRVLSDNGVKYARVYREPRVTDEARIEDGKALKFYGVYGGSNGIVKKINETLDFYGIECYARFRTAPFSASSIHIHNK